MKQNVLIILLWLGIIIPLKSVWAEGDLIILASICKSNTPCVEMILNKGETYKGHSFEKIEDGVLYRFKVEGSLNSGPIQTYEVEFFAGVGEMECSNFTQGNVAVSGWTKTGPILQTYQGDLAVMGGELKIGCENCLEIKDEKTQKTLASYKTPSWDLSLTRSEAEHISYDQDHNAYILRKNQCLQIPQTGLIKQVSLKKCISTKNVGHFSQKYKNFILKSGEWLYKRAGFSTIVRISHGGCR